MKHKNQISQLTLEMYHLDALTPRERKIVEAELSSDNELHLRYETLKKSDNEIRRRFSLESPPESPPVPVYEPEKFSHNKKLLIGLGMAAALVLCALTALVFLKGHSSNNGTEMAEDEGKDVGIEFDITEEKESRAEITENSINDGVAISADPDAEERKTENKNESYMPSGDSQSVDIKPDDPQSADFKFPDFQSSGVYVADIPNTGTQMRGGSTEDQQTEQQSNLNIPTGLSSIFENMFADRQLTFVVIPNRITSIGKNAFADNPLVSITIGANVTLDDTSFPGNFAGAYNNYGRAAGIYTRTDTGSNLWVKE